MGASAARHDRPRKAGARMQADTREDTDMWIQEAFRSIRDASPDEKRGFAVLAGVIAACIAFLYVSAALRLMGWW